MIRGIIETLLVGIAFGVTTINVYAFMIYMDETINENRLYATSPGGIFTTAVLSGIIVHGLNAYIFPGKLRWAHCGC